MKIINAGYEILDSIPVGALTKEYAPGVTNTDFVEGLPILQKLERIARVCYQSGENTTDDGQSAMRMMEMLIRNGHEAMLEHEKLTVLFTCDRGVSHELVRHRIASFAQESTRYCNYSKGKFGNEITVIRPCFLENGSRAFNDWSRTMVECENRYFDMLEAGSKPEEARDVLPTSLKTEVVVTANLREWRHILKLRCAKDAHPQMKEIMIPLLIELKRRIPVLFADIWADWDWWKEYKGADAIEVFGNMVHLFYKEGAKHEWQ